jgi:hypothetical protein
MDLFSIYANIWELIDRSFVLLAVVLFFTGKRKKHRRKRDFTTKRRQPLQKRYASFKNVFMY